MHTHVSKPADIEAYTELFRRTGVLPAPLEEYRPIPERLRPAWDAFQSLHKLAGANGISVADLCAHMDLVGIHRRQDREEIYHHVIELEQERQRLVNSEQD